MGIQQLMHVFLKENLRKIKPQQFSFCFFLPPAAKNLFVKRFLDFQIFLFKALRAYWVFNLACLRVPSRLKLELLTQPGTS